MTRITLNGLTYFYRVTGHGPPLLLLHGFTGSSENWLEIGERFGEAYRVYMLDLPGHGETESPADPKRYGMELVALDLLALLGALGIKDMHLLGYSMGGRLALYMAARHPECLRSLILESASPGLALASERRARRAADGRLAAEIEAEGIAHFVDKWEHLPLFATQNNVPLARRQRQRRQRLGSSATGLANSLRGMGTGSQPSLWDELSGMHLPALILAGALDAKYAALAQKMGAALPQGDVQIIPNTGHNVHFERPQTFAGAVQGFLAGLK